MRTASFLFASITLHAAALAYPAFFLAPEDKATPIIVTVVESAGGGGSGGEMSSQSAGRAAAPMKKPTARPANRKPAMPDQPRPSEIAAARAEPVSFDSIATDLNSPIQIPRNQNVTLATADSGAFAMSGSSAGRGASGGGRGSGGGSGGGNGSGTGNGDGDGSGRFVQASYLDCPKADHPEAAKRQGQQGRVVVEVVIDKEGWPKSSRVLESSGFALLDRAAVDNIQRHCRFHPAHRGEKEVETSVKIPVEFRFADSKAR
jgi:periplasmic protein TonB